MFTHNLFRLHAAGLAASLVLSGTAIGADQDAKKLIADWPAQPQLAAQQMMAKYGEPKEATSEQLIWHDEGPYKRITVSRVADPHDFPLPHMDFLEHTINFDVPADKVSAITAYDGSVTVDRTKGEMSARCDVEGHNILSLNLANDIVTGKQSTEGARKAFGEIVVQDTLGQKPAYVTALQFKPATKAAADSDKPVIPGSPLRAAVAEGQAKGDAEVLAYLVAVNLNEINAAMQAEQEKAGPRAMQFAKEMHTEHGQNLKQTMQLGQQIGVTPIVTADVTKLRDKGAGELAMLVPLDGEKFGDAYLKGQVAQHEEVLKMIDGPLMKSAQNDAVKKHLKETRGHVAMHLEQAKKLQDGAMRQASDQ